MFARREYSCVWMAGGAVSQVTSLSRHSVFFHRGISPANTDYLSRNPTDISQLWPFFVRTVRTRTRSFRSSGAWSQEPNDATEQPAGPASFRSPENAVVRLNRIGRLPVATSSATARRVVASDDGFHERSGSVDGTGWRHDRRVSSGERPSAVSAARSPRSPCQSNTRLY